MMFEVLAIVMLAAKLQLLLLHPLGLSQEKQHGPRNPNPYLSWHTHLDQLRYKRAVKCTSTIF